MQITVLSGGKWGSALAQTYAHKYPDQKITLWIWSGIDYDGTPLAEYVRKERVNPLAFPDVQYRDNIEVTGDIVQAVEGADIVISAIPSEHLPPFLTAISEANFAHFVNASKGVINDKPISYHFKSVLPSIPYATIAGPNIARQAIDNFAEGAQVHPAFSTLAHDELSDVELLGHVLDYKPYFRMYACNDIHSVEYCSLFKQVYGLALGLCVGLGYDGNTVAGVFQSCGREIKRMLEFFGCNPRVYDDSYAGYPDLEVTYKFGRHGRIGKLMAEEGLEAAQKAMEHEYIEGFRILASLHAAVKDTDLHLPILRQLHAVVHEGRPLEEALKHLLY